VIDDERQRVSVLGTNVDEVNAEPVDLGDELGERVQRRLAPTPVVLGRPIASEFLNHRERHALRLIVDRLLLGPLRGRDASTEVVQGLVWNVDLERTNLGCGLRSERPGRTRAKEPF
jgi:hypothetical protein